MSRHALISIIALFASCGSAMASRPGELGLPADMNGVGIVEKPGEALPLDLSFTDDRGRDITLRELLKPGLPIVLNLGYYRCPSVCGLVMQGMVTTMKATSLMPGEDYVVISLTIDPSETHKLAAGKKSSFIRELGRSEATRGWHFLTGSEANIKAVTDAAGFYYRWVESADQFAHPSGIIILTPDGKISRYLHGKDFDAQTFRLSLVEASQGKIGSILDQLMLICFAYDKDKHQYTMAAVGLMRIGGGAMLLTVACFAVWAVRRERQRSATSPTESGGNFI